MKLGLMVFLLAIVSGFAGWYLGGSSSERTSMAPVMSDKDSRRIIELEQQIDSMKKNIAALKEKQAFSSPSVDPVNTAKRSDVPVSRADNSIENGSDNTAPQNNQLQSAPTMAADPVSAIASLPQKFASEEVDTKWALEHEKKLQEVLYKDVGFQMKELMSITCKSTICEVKIKADKKEGLMKTGSDLNRLLMNRQPNVFDPNMMIKYSESEKSGSFYFAGMN